jgi:hypothetical protein
MPNGPNNDKALVMAGKNRFETVDRVEGELQNPSFPEGFKVRYEISVTKNEERPVDTKTLGEQVLKVIKESGL